MAVFIGVVSAWVTVNDRLSRLEARVEQSRIMIERLQDRMDTQTKALNDVGQVATRVETKMDILLDYYQPPRDSLTPKNP